MLGARQRRGRRRLALRPRPLRLRDVRRREAGRRAAAERRRGGELGGGDRGRGRRACARPAAPGRGDRRRRLQRGGLPGPAAAARGARLPARRLAPLARPRPRGAGPARPARALGQGRATSTSADADPRPRHRPAAQLADPRPAHPQGDPPQRRPLAVATERPTALDGGAEAIARYAPGEGAHFVAELARGASAAPRTSPRRWPRACASAGKVVVIWGERIARDGDGADGPARRSPPRSASPSTDGSGLLEVPDFANARGLREAGCLPDAGPGLRARARPHGQ